ncbi:MAG: multidrug effflux MFS transporter [Acidimicrobiia bacterium]
MPPVDPPKRVELTVMVAMIMATGALGIDLMLPAFGAIRESFGLPEDSTATARIVTAYFVGMAVGQLVFGVISDRYGRRRALHIGLWLYVVAATAAAVSPTLNILLAARFVWGFAASGPRVVAVAVVRDLFEGDRMAQAMSFIMAVFVLVPVVAPTLGAAVLAVSNWHWVFGVCVIFALGLLLWTRRLPETLDPAHRRDLRFATFVEAGRIVLTNRSTMAYTVGLTLLFGVFSSYLASSELIVGGIIGRPDMFPLIFGGLAAVMGTAMVANGSVVRRFGTTRMATGGLWAYVGWAWAMAAASIVWGGVPGVAVYMLGVAPLLALHALVFPNLNTAAMQPMGAIAGIASAVIGTISTAVGAVIGAVIDRSMGDTITPLAIGFAVAGTLALAITLWGAPTSGRSEPAAPGAVG